MKHELWTNEAGLDLFCLAGPLGDSARKLLDLDYRLVGHVMQTRTLKQ